MDIKKALATFGLSEVETKVYLAALKLGQAMAPQLAKAAAVDRVYFYTMSKRLIERGILKETTVGKKRYLVPTSPRDLLKHQQQKIEEAQKTLPQLEALLGSHAADDKPKVYFFKGADGFEAICDDLLTHKGEIVGYATPKHLTKDEKKVSANYVKSRVTVGNRIRCIGEISKELMLTKSRDKKELRELRLLPQRLFHSDIEFAIYGDKVSLRNLNTSFGIVIDDKDFADMQRQIFELIWDGGKIVS